MTGHRFTCDMTMPDGTTQRMIVNFDAAMPDFDARTVKATVASMAWEHTPRPIKVAVEYVGMGET